MSSIKSRLRRIEERAGSAGRCPECGQRSSDGQGQRIVFIDEGAPRGGFQGDSHERCERCGRFLYTVIQVVYDDPPAAAELEGEGA